MSDILAKLKAAHAKRKRVRVDVPEYGLVLYFPPLTIEKHAQCRRGVNIKDEAALLANTLMVLAETEDGKRAFDLTGPDAASLRAAVHDMDYGVLRRILTEAGGDPLTATAQAEIAALDEGAVRRALVGALGGSDALAKSIEAVPGEMILAAVARLAAQGEAQVSVKNG
jgi:hypothetical protein